MRADRKRGKNMTGNEEIKEIKIVFFTTGISKKGVPFGRMTCRAKLADGTSSKADFFVSESVVKQMTLDGIGEDDTVELSFTVDKYLRPVISAVEKVEV